MIYDKKRRLKKRVLMLVTSMFLVSSIIPYFGNMNKVEARITSNLPKSYMSDEFPDSYKPYINSLKNAHSNWVFKAVYTGLDWNEAVSHESYDVNDGISLVPDSYDAAWKKDGQNYYKDGNFVIASKDAVKYMLDPRGHINEKEVFQFQTLSYSQHMDSIDSIEKVLWGTSMYNRSEYQRAGSMINMGQTYSNIILGAAQKYGVSAIHIASRIKQETAGAITSNRSINGSTTVNGVIPYNYFNIGATPPNAIDNGLRYAANKGWTDPVSGINGGTDELKNKWIKWGQDTTYFQKFDVNNPFGNALWLYGSQYMTNIIAPTNESYSTYTAYEKMGLLNSNIEFHIPVYNNMPSYPTPYPGTSGNAANYVDDNTRIEVYDVAPYILHIRSGPGTEYSTVAKLNEGDQMTRIAKSTNTQWDKVRLDNGIEGYVFRDYTREIKIVEVNKVSLNKTSVELNVGETSDLVATVTPNDATNKNISWSSSDNNIATVENGKITAKNPGSVTIEARSNNNITATCKVNVISKVESISIDKDSYNLVKGKYLVISPVIKPANASNKEYTIISDNENVVKIVDGKLYGENVGEATITYTTKDSNKTAKVKIKVLEISENDLLTFDDSVKVDESNNHISKVNPETKVSTIADKIVYNNEKYDLVIKNASGKNIEKDELIGTGTTVNLCLKNSNDIIETYTIIIYGDVNGDGKIYATDYVKIKNHIMDTEKLNGVYAIAADVNRDSKVYATDYVKVKNYIMGTGEISQ